MLRYKIDAMLNTTPKIILCAAKQVIANITRITGSVNVTIVTTIWSICSKNLFIIILPSFSLILQIALYHK